MSKKITKATLKGFIRKNATNLFLNVKREFDGMTDGCEARSRGFERATLNSDNEHSMGVDGLWLVDGSRNRFSAYEDKEFVGIEYYNCCGCGVVAIKK